MATTRRRLRSATIDVPVKYNAEELKLLLRSAETYYFRLILLGGHEFQTVEVLNPNEWWVLVEPATMVEFLETNLVQRPRWYYTNKLEPLFKRLPWPLVVKLREEKENGDNMEALPQLLPQIELERIVAGYPRKCDNLPLYDEEDRRKAIRHIKNAVADSGELATDLSAPEAKAHRRSITTLDAFSAYHKPEQAEENWYKVPRHLRVPVGLNSRGEIKVGSCQVSLEDLTQALYSTPWQENGEWEDCLGACYPCLVAGRHCKSRARHKDQLWSRCCTACRTYGLGFGHCAVPAPPVPETAADALEGAWKPKDSWFSWLHKLHQKRSQTDCLACHICGIIGPCLKSTECVACHIWVCGNPATEIILRAEVSWLPRKLCRSADHQRPEPEELRRARCRGQVDLAQLEDESCFIDDAAGERSLSLIECVNLRVQLTQLRRKVELMPEHKRLFCFEWLESGQQIGTPDMALAKLIQIHGDFENSLVLNHRSEELYFKNKVPTFLDATIAGWKLPNKEWIEESSRKPLQHKAPLVDRTCGDWIQQPLMSAPAFVSKEFQAEQGEGEGRKGREGREGRGSRRSPFEGDEDSSSEFDEPVWSIDPNHNKTGEVLLTHGSLPENMWQLPELQVKLAPRPEPTKKTQSKSSTCSKCSKMSSKKDDPSKSSKKGPSKRSKDSKRQSHEAEAPSPLPLQDAAPKANRKRGRQRPEVECKDNYVQ
eukprot:Skav220807  [mRNA]  locus=scaffold150:442801:445165:+ [translate_table: standard]